MNGASQEAMNFARMEASGQKDTTRQEQKEGIVDRK